MLQISHLENGVRAAQAGEKMREWENLEMRKFGNERMRKWENEKIREWGNERMRKWGNGEVTFWNINFAKISNFGKVRTAKAMC